jgi:antibiotic biosynthesis monooxygenase
LRQDPNSLCWEDRQLIARVATFNSLRGEEWLDNVRRRVAPATLQMRGNMGGFWLQDPSTGKVISISFWESEEAMRSNQGLQSVPLLPGQDAAKIPSADAQEFYEVVYATADLVKQSAEP